MEIYLCAAAKKSLNSFKNKRAEHTANDSNSCNSNNSAEINCSMQTRKKQWRKKTRSASFRFTSAKAIKTTVGIITETTTLALLSKWITKYEIVVVVVATLAVVGSCSLNNFSFSLLYEWSLWRAIDANGGWCSCAPKKAVVRCGSL